MSTFRFEYPLVLALVLLMSASVAYSKDDEAEAIRQLERERLGALVNADVQRARELHSEEFQLVNPRGETLTKDQYLGGIKSGQLDYLLWEPVSPIVVRLHGDAAVIRYRARLEIVVDGQRVPEAQYWHTDFYEKHAGKWQVVWSQATLASQ
jgi:ketosteroid isomerase-like protein